MDANQLLFRYLVYYPVVWSRGQRVPGHLRRLAATQWLPPAGLRALQAERLGQLLAHARRTVPHYAASLPGLPAGGGFDPARLAELPVVTKTDLKRDPASFACGERLRMLTPKTTGGSTGEPVTILKTRDAMAWELAATWRGYAWAGIRIGDRQGRFWGVPAAPAARRRAALIDFVTHRRRCSAFSFDDQDLERYTRELAGFRPTHLYGYVSMIEAYARFLERTGRRSPFELAAIVTTSEVLGQPQRELIERVFRARVFNEYGSGELGTVAHECERGRLHVSAENLVVEVLDGDRACAPGETGELVITELHNRAMPLIRYRTGDFASMSPEPCPCGRHLPVIENLHGRAYDIVRNRAGKVFHGEYFMYVFEDAQRRDLGIRAFQVVQRALDAFDIRVVPGPGYGPATEAFVAEGIRRGFDREARIRFERVERIERLPSGKMRLIVGLGEPSVATDACSDSGAMTTVAPPSPAVVD